MWAWIKRAWAKLWPWYRAPSRVTTSFHCAKIAARLPRHTYPFPGPPLDNGAAVIAEFAHLRATGGAPAWVETWRSRYNLYEGYSIILSWAKVDAPQAERDHAALAAYVQIHDGGKAHHVRVHNTTWFVFARRHR